MSGRPGSVGPRPRVLVYVAEPRLDARDPGADPALYKPVPATAKLGPYDYLKDPCVLEARPDQPNIDGDCASGVEYQPVTRELTSYQRCSDHANQDNSGPPLGQSNFVDSVTPCERTGDKELLVGKNCVNYQFLEQSLSHQSIVNQSISILNQQVGVSRVSDGEAPQLVRTSDGVVLAVLPPPLLQSVDVTEPSSRPVQSDSQQTIIVPLGWRRIINGPTVLYVSPSGTALGNLPQLREYLQTTGTCKCGLPCPLRPETAFSFDPKVVSKPYQPASGAELTKLCNHKRKLLATLQAQGSSPSTPPPQQLDPKKGTGTEVAVLKKKMKKRPGFPPNISMSQLMVQRERPLNDFKPQDADRTVSPGVSVQANNGQSYPTNFTALQQNVHSNVIQDDMAKQDNHVQRSSHYLTVSNGWISQQQENVGHKPSQHPMNHPNAHAGMPVVGTNGQIIGVNTLYNKQQNYKNTMSGMQTNIIEQEQKEEKEQNPSKPKEEESQIFCGLNQPLTPEVMQKINEQQQIFIQQNQKQIEMAMKGFRTQMVENQNKTQNQNQYMHQGQLVIQNGAVVKTNPAKTPPWQVKRTESSGSSSSSLSSVSPKHSIELEDSNLNTSEESVNHFNSYPNNDQQAMCSRVPPLPQHYNMMGHQWPAEINKKKTKANSKNSKKKLNPNENKAMSFGNHTLRHQHDMKTCEDIPNNNVPSFMDDPNGYLAQQTVLLNNTISKQVGINCQYDSNQYEGTNSCYNMQNTGDKNCKLPHKPCEVINVYRSNVVPNSSPSPNNTPDSSEKIGENPASQCCKGCNVSMKGPMNPEFNDGKPRYGYAKSNPFKTEMEGGMPSTSPRSEESPVTSSTFMERSPLSDHCGPIQAGTVSTSHVSPASPSPPPPPPPRDFSSPPASYHLHTPPTSQPITGPQIMHFISNHNVNKNLMEVDNISMVGIKPGMKRDAYRTEPMRRRMENTMPGYCPPPHLGGGPAHSLIQTCYIQTFVTTMASGFSVTRDTVTSVLAGKANTATTSINAAQVNFIRPPPPPSVNLATSYAIPNNQPDPFLNSVNLPTSYPLHIAGTTAQNMISKSPLEMVQNVIGNLPSKHDLGCGQTVSLSQSGKRRPTTPGQILISSTGQIIVSNGPMFPPPPKSSTSMSSMQNATNVSTSVNQVVSAVGGVQNIVNQPTVVVNTMSPFMLQPPMMAVDGQVVQQNTVMPQIVGGIVPGQSINETSRQIDVKSQQNFVQGVAMLSPESLKKRNKKKKGASANITNVLQITAPQQNASNIMVHSSPQNNTSPQFSPRGFQLSPNNNISPTPMLQALTIVPGKSGTPAHIVMNGQGNTNNYGSQQIITNTSPSQQINLLQPVNLINSPGGVMSNFPFQQFIVPNLGGMMMTADGAAIIQDNGSGMPMQLQLQTVNGQNVLTPVQNSGVFAGANGGVVLRAQNQQGKIIQSQHSPTQFLSPGGQVVVNGPTFNGQLSPLLAGLSPPGVAFGSGAARPGPEFLHQANQLGQAVVVPLSPKRRANSTFVHQNTTIVQQQTTLVSNSQSTHAERRDEPDEGRDGDAYARLMSDLIGYRQSVSTQTLVAARRSPARWAGSSPPDTTTHSPRPAPAPADTTTRSPEPADATSSAMVQCVSSSEQDMAESRDNAWSATRLDYSVDTDTQNPISNMQMMRNRVHPHSAESTDVHYSHSAHTHTTHNTHTPHNTHTTQNTHTTHNTHTLPPLPQPVPSNYYDRQQTYKRKHEFTDYRTDKMMRTNYNMVHGMQKNTDFDSISMTSHDKGRHYQTSGPNSESQKVFDRRNLAPGDDGKKSPNQEAAGPAGPERKFTAGDLVWGPVKGYASWPGKLVARAADGRWTVRWFGARSPGRGSGRGSGRVDHPRLLTLSEGLEAHHEARTRHRKSRKLNTLLENAIQEAMAELDKKSELADEDRSENKNYSDCTTPPITETPKRVKKHEKIKKDKQTKHSLKVVAPKSSDNSRLRSSR